MLMLIRSFSTLIALCATAIVQPCHAGISGEFDVGFGPVTLGGVILTSFCKDNSCNYNGRARGSFLFIGANVEERGTYRISEGVITPVETSYREKIGSKRKSFRYDFSTMQIENRRTNKTKEMEQNAYPFIPLLNQVVLDLALDGPKKKYTYLAKHKIKTVELTSHRAKPVENGTLHHIVVEKKDKSLEFYLIQQGSSIELQKLYYGNFWMIPKK